MRLRPLLAACIGLVAATTNAPVASAQQMGCMGPVQMDFGLEIQRDQAYHSVLPSMVPYFLSQAECLCQPRDIYVRGTARALYPRDTQKSYEVWVGGTCTSNASRVGSPPQCQQVKETTTDLSHFRQGASSPPRQLLPVRAVIAPNVPAAKDSDPCAPSSPSNAMFFLFIDSGKSEVGEYCSLTLPARTRLPSPPEKVSANAGDGAATVRWTAPMNDVPSAYQVLCAETSTDDEGNPTSKPIAALQTKYTGKNAYSTCYLDGPKLTLARRAGLEGSGGAGDGDGGVSDGDGGVVADGGVVDPSPGDEPPLETSRLEPSADEETKITAGPDEFNGLDPRYVCTDRLDRGATSARIDGLENGKTYRFVVVGIDDFGNPAAAEVIEAKPQPVEDLYRRFRGQGGAPQGFCFIATAAFGSPQSPYVDILRRFRDRVLLPTAPGRVFVDWYYRHSPPAAAYVAEHDGVRFVVRQLLWPVVALAALWLWLAAWHKAALCTLLFGVVLGRRLRRRGQGVA